MGCTTELPFLKPILEKTVQAKGFQMISPQTNIFIFFGIVEVDQYPPITNQEWRKQQSQD